MAESGRGQHHPEQHEHFDLGVDTLASGAEIGDMHDPWSPGPQPVAIHLEPTAMPVPEGDLSAWQDPQQLPGM